MPGCHDGLNVFPQRPFSQRDPLTSDRPEVLTLNAGDECDLVCMAVSADVFPLAASVLRELEVSLSLDTNVELANSGPQVSLCSIVLYFLYNSF